MVHISNGKKSSLENFFFFFLNRSSNKSIKQSLELETSRFSTVTALQRSS